MKTQNRVISLLLVACMMLSLCAALPFVASAEVVSTSGWDGKTATQPEGSGAKEDPYLIADAANLLWLQKQIPAADRVNDSHAHRVLFRKCQENGRIRRNLRRTGLCHPQR